MKPLALIGHRGVGKSSTLDELSRHFPKVVCVSLDAEIVKNQGRTIKEIFTSDGEEKFRQIEITVFKELVSRLEGRPFVIDIGAGFLGEIPQHIHCVWLKRRSHSPHSMYPDRPNLDAEPTMSVTRYLERESRYKKRADLTLQLREGPRHFQEGEKVLFAALIEGKCSDDLNGYYYSLTSNTTELEKSLLLQLGLKGFEYRNDWTKSDAANLQRDLVSLKVRGIDPPNNCETVDWPLEWGPNLQSSILSFHEKSRPLNEVLEGLPETKQILKLAIPIENFAELKLGHQWAQEAPERRAFLPMSEEGRWSWYRSWVARNTPVKFLRLHEGSAPDQPSVLEILNAPREATYFAAVLGHPVSHSWTPTFQQEYFFKKQAPVFAIDLAESEWNVALPFLQELGLRWVAVTAPLKNRAADWVQKSHALNTLCFTQQQWVGTNTDVFGVQALIQGFENDKVAVWGGGGTLSSIVKILPRASFYSSRTGELKAGEPIDSPTHLIWAVGPQAFKEKGVFPPKNWPIQSVFDLNYSSDSPGIECAWNYGCQYRSGVVMFEAQALKQQEFWNECRVE